MFSRSTHMVYFRPPVIIYFWFHRCFHFRFSIFDAISTIMALSYIISRYESYEQAMSDKGANLVPGGWMSRRISFSTKQRVSNITRGKSNPVLTFNSHFVILGEPKLWIQKITCTVKCLTLFFLKCKSVIITNSGNNEYKCEKMCKTSNLLYFLLQISEFLLIFGIFRKLRFLPRLYRNNLQSSLVSDYLPSGVIMKFWIRKFGLSSILASAAWTAGLNNK